MCPHAADSAPAVDKADMVEVPLASNVKPNGVDANGKRGTSRASARPQAEQQQRNPYAPRASDFLSNVSNFNIIESTLRGAYLSSLHLDNRKKLTSPSIRGRAVCQCVLRHQNQDRHRKGA